MAKGKVYAVLRGRNPGVYSTWAECEKQVKGFPNAAFKSFPTVVEALEWIENGKKGAGEVGKAGSTKSRQSSAVESGKESGVKAAAQSDFVKLDSANAEEYFREDHLDTNVLPAIMPKNYAFVDGSYNANYKGKSVYGYGGLVHVNGQEETIQGTGWEEEYIVSHQIPGEAFGSIKAIEKAIEMGAEHVVIFYDYAGIGHWATSGKRWKAEKPIAKEYVRRYDALAQKIKVNFYHVKAHTQIEGNELVDRLAKQAVGIL